MDSKQTKSKEVRLEINTPGDAKNIVIEGDIGSIHEDPSKIHKLLDLLGMPQGTEVTVTTRGATVIVR